MNLQNQAILNKYKRYNHEAQVNQDTSFNESNENNKELIEEMMFDENHDDDDDIDKYEPPKNETSIVEEIKMNDYVEANKIVDNF